MSQDVDDLFESCLSTCSLEHNAATHETYSKSLQHLANVAGTPCQQRNICGYASHLVPKNRADSQVTSSARNQCYSPRREPLGSVDISVQNAPHLGNFTADVTSTAEADSLLNKTFSSLNISSDSSIGQSWLSLDLSTVTESDITMVTALSDSSCSLHSVRIERQPIATDDDNHCSLVEAVLIPSDQINADTSCQQHENLECSYLSDDQTFLSDWKTAPETPNAGDTKVDTIVPASVKALSAVELRTRLTQFGESPGPIIESTRRLHEQRLCRLMAGCQAEAKSSLSAGSCVIYFYISV